MELIYSDSNFVDIGVMKDYTLDLAYGIDENNFECVIALDQHCCDRGYHLYVIGTEYGGVIDAITVDSENRTVSYSGRTWHGILFNSVICPEAKTDYYTIQGDANECIAEIISYLGISDIFVARAELSGITINEYQFERFTDAYTGLIKMLSEYDARLVFNVKYDGTCELYAVPSANYGTEEQFDSIDTKFNATNVYNAVNHMICCGEGDLGDRAVIHIFTDENGGVQPYTLRYPYEDNDYILDRRNQKLFGKDEIAEYYDAGSQSGETKYKPVTVAPKNWSKVCESYFYRSIDEEGNVSYRNYEITESEQWVKDTRTTKPPTWDTNCTEWAINSTGTPVEMVESTTYHLLTKKPKNWVKESVYSTYFVRDGLGNYTQVSSDSKSYFKLTTVEPSDFEVNYSNYYIKDGKEYKALVRKRKWRKNTFYFQASKNVAPKWAGINYYYAKTTVSAPAWQSNHFYINKTVFTYPKFVKTNCYVETLDRYSSMVENAIEKLKEYWKDSMSVEILPSFVYFVGDSIGVYDAVTGLSLTQDIVKKIVKIERGLETISYEVGEL